MSDITYPLEFSNCPFCGGWKMVYEVRNAYDPRYRIICDCCGASTRSCKTLDEAIASWNMRHDTSPEKKEGETK